MQINMRMSVRARCQSNAGAGAGEDQPGAGLGDGVTGRCELSGKDAVNLVDLFAGAERDAEKMRYLQGRERWRGRVFVFSPETRPKTGWT